MDLAKERILVTGAGGFIGSHLTESLVRRGGLVRAFIHYNSLNSRGWLDTLPETVCREIEFFPGDIRDPHRVAAALRGCGVVFHLAALIAIPYSYYSADSYLETNIGGTLNLLQAARQLGTAKVIHTSTSEVYGTAQRVPIDEQHPLQAQSPYAATKIAADQLALSFYRSFNTPVTIVRPFNTYGPRQSARAIIPTIITQIAAGRKVIELGALHPTRDFNYVSDTVNGFISAAQADSAGGEVINLGSGNDISIGELVQLIAGLMGTTITITARSERLRPKASEVERLLADNGKAKRLLGWQPVYRGREGLQRGLQETIAWFSDPANLRRYQTEGYQL